MWKPYFTLRDVDQRPNSAGSKPNAIAISREASFSSDRSYRHFSQRQYQHVRPAERPQADLSAPGMYFMVSPLPISTSKSKLETSLLKNSITSLVSKTFSSSEERRKPIIFCFSSELTPSLDTAIRAHTATVPCINFCFLKRPTGGSVRPGQS